MGGLSAKSDAFATSFLAAALAAACCAGRAGSAVTVMAA